jgi:hypothetical protein
MTAATITAIAAQTTAIKTAHGTGCATINGRRE